MLAPISPVQADAEALFKHTLQPLVDAAATAESSGMSVGWVVGGAVVISLIGLVGYSLWPNTVRPSQDVLATRSPSIPFSPVPMTRFLLLLAAVLVAAPAFAQTHAEAMARLAPYHGSYSLDGTAEMIEGSSDEDGTFGGTLDVSPILGGHFQQWDWEMTMPAPEGGDTVHLRFVTTYNTETGAYDIWRFDIRDIGEQARPGGNETHGTLHFDGDALVMAWPTANPDNPSQTGTFRNTVHLQGRGIEVVTDAQPDDGSPTVAIATTRAARR